MGFVREMALKWHRAQPDGPLPVDPTLRPIVGWALRDIPSIRLNDQSLVQLGHGVHQKRIRATMTSLTGSLGVDIASDKKLTNKLLAATGVPVPRAEVVRDADAAVVAAKRIGYPVAMKPLDGTTGAA
jgi:cyanophycin synthetase